jgi:nickel/cobalt exporter
MGFAGGLLPSPSAVVVLVGANALGRPWFGVGLVLAYGVGLALTLALVGLLVTGPAITLVRHVAGRLAASKRGGRLRGLLLGRIRLAAPAGTAALVVLLGLGLMLRSLPAAFA